MMISKTSLHRISTHFKPEKPHELLFRKYRLAYRAKNFESAKKNILSACIGAAEECGVNINTKIATAMAKACHKAIDLLAKLYKKLMDIILNIGNNKLPQPNNNIEKIEDILYINPDIDSQNQNTQYYSSSSKIDTASLKTSRALSSNYMSCSDG